MAGLTPTDQTLTRLEFVETKSPLVLEYLGGESGFIMIVALLIVDGVLIHRLRGRSPTSEASSQAVTLPTGSCVPLTCLAVGWTSPSTSPSAATYTWTNP